MPRVLFVDHTAELGGAELFLCDLAAALGQSQVVLLEDGALSKRLSHLGVAVHVLDANLSSFRRNSGFAQSLALIPTLLSVVPRLSSFAANFDVICSNSQKAAVIAMLAGALARKPVIVYLHDIINDAHFSGFSQALFVWLSRRFASRVLTNSSATKDAYVAAGGRRDKTFVLHNGFNLLDWTAIDGAALEKGDGLPVVGCFSRLAAWKGQHVLLKAVKRMKLPTKVVLAGAPLFGEEHYETQLRQQVANDHILRERVSFRGFVDDTKPLMRQCDVVVLPSISPEPFGRTVVEAQLLQRAVVATDGGGVRDIVEDNVTGLLVRASDENDLAGALDKLLGDAALRKKIADAAYASARSKFSLETLVSGFQRMIHEVLGA